MTKQKPEISISIKPAPLDLITDDAWAKEARVLENTYRAAPELLAVCERLLEDAAKYKKVQYEAGTFAALNAAIAKATGE